MLDVLVMSGVFVLQHSDHHGAKYSPGLGRRKDGIAQRNESMSLSLLNIVFFFFYN